MSSHLSLSAAAYGQFRCFHIEDVKIPKMHIALLFFLPFYEGNARCIYVLNTCEAMKSGFSFGLDVSLLLCEMPSSTAIVRLSPASVSIVLGSRS